MHLWVDTQDRRLVNQAQKWDQGDPAITPAVAYSIAVSRRKIELTSLFINDVIPRKQGYQAGQSQVKNLHSETLRSLNRHCR